MFPEQGTLNDNEITIQLSLDGFSYVVYNQTHKKFTQLERLTEERPSLHAAIEKIESKYNCDIADFAKIIVIFDNCANTFVPASIFQNQEKGRYLDLLGIKDEDSIAATDFLKTIEANNVFSISNADATTLSELFGDIQIRHSASILVSSLIKNNIHHSNEPIVHLNVKNRQFDMVVTKGCNLLFHNTFSFKTKEDFLYFLLFAIDQLRLDTGKVPVYFLGMIEEKSQLVELTSRYIRDIRFVRRDDEVVFDEEIEKEPYFHNYILFNSLCEL